MVVPFIPFNSFLKTKAIYLLEKLIREGEKDGTISITANTIETDKTFDI